jgi:hypothetical protein
MVDRCVRAWLAGWLAAAIPHRRARSRPPDPAHRPGPDGESGLKTTVPVIADGAAQPQARQLRQPAEVVEGVAQLPASMNRTTCAVRPSERVMRRSSTCDRLPTVTALIDSSGRRTRQAGRSQQPSNAQPPRPALSASTASGAWLATSLAARARRQPGAASRGARDAASNLAPSLPAASPRRRTGGRFWAKARSGAALGVGARTAATAAGG